MICQILMQHGYNVMEAANGVEALKVYGSNIHLVLTDVVMPEMNTRDADRLRQINPSTRMIFMSGYSDDPWSIGSKAGRLSGKAVHLGGANT